MFGCEGCQSFGGQFLIGLSCDDRGCLEAGGCGLYDSIPILIQFQSSPSDIAEQQIGLSGSSKSRVGPDGYVMLVSITGISRCQPESEGSGSCRDRQSDFLSHVHGVRRNLPRFRPIAFADMTDGGEPPERLLPCGDAVGQGHGIGGLSTGEFLSQAVEQQGGRGVLQRIPECVEIARAEFFCCGNSCDIDRAIAERFAMIEQSVEIPFECSRPPPLVSN